MEVRTWSWTALALLGSAGLAHGQTWSMLPPPEARAGHAMAYDSGRGCTVMFAGVGSATLAKGTWEFWGDRWVHVPTAVSPPDRQLTAMAYDSGRGRVVLFGGTGTTTLGDTWEFDGANWTFVSTATSPPARTAHTMTYDPTIGAVVLFGGAGSGGAGSLADTWLYDGTDWTDVTPPSGPSARVGAALTFERTIGRSLLFGGNSSSRLGDTWTFDAQTRTWNQLQPNASPSARSYHAMAFDPARGCTMFGGYGSAPLGDTWVFLPTVPTWTPLTSSNSPSARFRHAMVYDPAVGCLLFGGAAPTPSDDTWASGGVGWRQIPTTLVPPARASTAFVHDGVRGQLLLHGGWNFPGGTFRTDTWALTDRTWTEIQTTNAPPGRIWRPMAYDSRRQRSVVFGGGLPGGNGWTMFDDTWELDHRTQAWTQIPTTAQPRPAIHYALAYDARRGVVVLFGGITVVNGVFANLRETWEWDGLRWTQNHTANAPTARVAPLVYDAGRGVVVLFGGSYFDPGQGDVRPLGETWEYDGVDWRRVPAIAPEPSDRWGSMTYDPTRGRVLLFGGITFANGSYAILGDLWQFDGTQWSQTPSPVSPPAGGPGAFAFDPDHDRAVMLWRIDTGGQPVGGIWQFEAAPIPTFTRYGFGCAGSNGTPSLDAAPGSLPALGGILRLDLRQLPPAGGTLLLGAGLGISHAAGLPLPLDLGFAGMPGCDLWIGLAPDLSDLRSFAGSTHQVALAIPNLAALAGLQLALQALVFDTAAPNGFASMSNAGIATIH
jgi:hypothetical protein